MPNKSWPWPGPARGTHMRWFLDVAYIALSASYKWLLGTLVLVGVLIGALFAAGVLGGGDDSPMPVLVATPVPTPIPTPG